jgi:hypothetical protein
MVMAGPSSMPSDLQIVEPDPSLPIELSAFFGKWEGFGGNTDWFLIVEKIDKEKASVYLWAKSSFSYMVPQGWNRCEALVTKQGGKYILQFRDSYSNYRLTVKEQYLDMDTKSGGARLRRVP